MPGLADRDIQTLTDVVEWINNFRADNMRRTAKSVYVGSGLPGVAGQRSGNWAPQQYIVTGEENDYILCKPYQTTTETVGTTEIKVAKPPSMRGGEERWGVYPAYVPDVSVIWAAPFLYNGAVDGDGLPILLMDMNLDGRSADGFWAIPSSPSANGTNKWTYTCTEQEWSSSGWSDLTDGRVVTAVLNSIEANNDGTGVQGNSVDIDGQTFTDNPDIELKSVLGDPVVWVHRSQDKTTGDYIYAFSYENAIDGDCA